MKCRQNWSKKCEDATNKQILMEYNASIAYHLMSCHFNRDDVGLKKLVDYFDKASLEEREHANKLMRYQNMRGGVVIFPDKIETMEQCLETSANDIAEAFAKALDLEKDVNQGLLELHKISEDEGDPQFCDFIESEFLNEQVEAISELSKILSVFQKFSYNYYSMWDYLEKIL